MNHKTENVFVKYGDQLYVLDAVSDSGMATIWFNGQPALEPEKELVFLDDYKK